jgi:hypothetical protein
MTKKTYPAGLERGKLAPATTGSLTPKERLSLGKQALPDSPIFMIGHVIGEKRLTSLSRNTRA